MRSRRERLPPLAFAAAAVLAVMSAAAIQAYAMRSVDRMQAPRLGTGTIELGDEWQVARERRWWGEVTVVKWGWRMAVIDPPRGWDAVPAIPARTEILAIVTEPGTSGELIQKAAGFPFLAWTTRSPPRLGQPPERRMRWGLFAGNVAVMYAVWLPVIVWGRLGALQMLALKWRRCGCCARCGYDRSGLTGADPCPECGSPGC